MNTKKIQYHHRAKQPSIDKTNSQVLTSSPIEIKLQDKNVTPYFLNKISDEDQELIDENISLRHTVQSINEKDDVNYLTDSQSLNKDLYLTTKNNKKEQPINLSIEDSDDHYIKASENLLSHLKGALEFLNSKEILTKNKDKIPTIIIYKEDYDKLRYDYDNVLKENLKLKEKNKQLKDNSSRGNNNMDNFNLSKFLDSLTYMQSKNQELEFENKKIKAENDELIQKMKHMKKMLTEDKHPHIKSNKNNSHSKSHVSVRAVNKNKNEMMEDLLKQQVKCMKKMICLVQDGKDSLEDSDTSRHKIDYNEEKSDSDIRFEESFNVMNLSNSVDYNMEDNHLKPLEKKNYDIRNNNNNHNQAVPKNQKFEIFLKPFEKKGDKKKENAIDDLQVFDNIKSTSTGAKNNTQPGKEYNTVYINKETNRSKILTNVQFNDRPIKKLGDASHRLFHHK